MINYFKLYTVSFFLFCWTYNFAQQKEPNGFNEILNKADKLSLQGNYDEALVLYEEAVKVIPDTISITNREKLYNSLTKKYAFLGLFDEARKRTRELYFQNLNVENKEYLKIGGSCLLGAYEALEGDYESALDFNVIYLAMVNEGEIFSKNCAYRIHALAGKEEQSIIQIQELMAKNPRPDYLLWLTYLLQKRGAESMVEQLLPKVEQFKHMAENGKIEGYDEGLVLYGLGMMEVIDGDHEKAIDYLKKSYSAGNKQYYWWKNFNPMFHELEEYSEYQDLMSKMKADIDQMRENYLESKSS